MCVPRALFGRGPIASVSSPPAPGGAIEPVRVALLEVTIEPKDVTLSNMGAPVGFFKGPNGRVVAFFQTH